jgi:dolichyl-phosphate beta-glucosyltransferase
MSATQPLDLSIIVPAFNEEQRIEPTLRQLDDFLRATGLRHEILVVDDGSSDGTVALVERMRARRPALSVIATSPNRGKGHAVRVGMLAARGAIRLLCDADGSIPASQIPHVIEPIRNGAIEVSIGSRYAAGASVAVAQPLWRRAWSRIVNRVVQRTLVPGVADTQCGFKAFSAAAAEAVFSRATIDGWAFDLEALALAHRLGYRIAELPVEWHDDARSRVRPLHDFMRVLREWLRIRKNFSRDVYALGA